MEEKSKVKINSRIASIKELTKQMKEIDDMVEIENLIKNNVIKFKFQDNDYRVRKLSSQEKRDITEKRMKKYIDLLKDDKYMLKDQWIEVYKKKGVSIREMDEKLIKLQNEQEKMYLELAKAEDKEIINDFKLKIDNLREQQTEVSYRKSELLQYSLETILGEYIQTYSGYLVLEKKAPLGELTVKGEDKYIRAFKTYEDFMNTDEKLFTRIMYFLDVLFTYGVE